MIIDKINCNKKNDELIWKIKKNEWGGENEKKYNFIIY